MSLHTTLRYDDPSAAIDHLTRTLGLRVVVAHTDDSGVIQHAELAWDDGPDTGVVLIGPRRADDPFDTGRAVLYLTTDDPDGVHARAVAAGATVAMELTDQPYGSREFAVSDPEGNRWSLGTYRPGS